MQPLIILTENAKNHFCKLISDDNAISLELKNSGCSGFKYVLNIINKTNIKEKQKLYKFQGIPFILEEVYLHAFNNMIIDYQKDGINNKIVFDNPNTMNECGCGESFSLKKE